MINFSKFNSIISLTSYFTSDAKCMQAIIESRWGVGEQQDVVCPYCDKHHCKFSKNGRFHCTECNCNFCCLVETMFENITYVHAFAVENTNRATLQPIIQQFVAKGSRVITDELQAYNGLEWLGYTHAVVNHGEEEYTNGDIFTNSIEGFWSHFRRMIVGCYHDVSDEHLQSYIDEAVYRWNTRKLSESERFAHMFKKSIGLVCKWSEIKVGLMAA